MAQKSLGIVQVGNVLLSIDCFKEQFVCNLAACHGACCIEGDAGAPVTLDEVMAIEEIVPEIEADLTEEAQNIIKSQGIAYTDSEGDLVTSIVNGKDCVFACRDKQGNCLCAIERAQREGRIQTAKPISCWLYPIRIKEFKGGLFGANYQRWDICQCSVELGRNLKIPVYKFLKEPLIARFGKDWYADLEQTALELQEQGLI